MIATTTSTTTATTSTANGSIFKMFYTFKRTQILLEDGWTNAKGIRVPGIKVKRIEKVSTTADYTDKKTGEVTTKFLNCVHVVYVAGNGKRCSTFVSCLAYVQRANFKRKEESRNYKAYQNYSNASQWSVYPLPKESKGIKSEVPQSATDIQGNVRTVNTVLEGVYCDCPDYLNQHQYLQQHPYLWQKVMQEKRMCKHAFSALNVLGLQSLEEYMQAWQPGGRLANLSAVMNKRTRSSY